jgi:hypothetical protein
VPEPLDPQLLFEVLARHKVEYVLIGGLAANLHGSPLVTNDADITPRRTKPNLRRLAAALVELDARIRTAKEPGGFEFARDAEFLGRVKMVNMQTRAGDFDITFEPGGFSAGYDELLPHAVPFDIFGVLVLVAALRDIIHSKEAANRLKDQAALPVLYALEDEIAAAEREGGASR